MPSCGGAAGPSTTSGSSGSCAPTASSATGPAAASPSKTPPPRPPRIYWDGCSTLTGSRWPGAAMSPGSPPTRAGCMLPACWTWPHDTCSAGRWGPTTTPGWSPAPGRRRGHPRPSPHARHDLPHRQGGEYTATTCVQACQRLGLRRSMSRTGSCLDNAVAESFFASLKVELVDRAHYRTAPRPAPPSSAGSPGTTDSGCTPPVATCHPLSGNTSTPISARYHRQRPHNPGVHLPGGSPSRARRIAWRSRLRPAPVGGHGRRRSTITSIEDLACWLCPTPMPPTSPTTCGWPSAGSLGACSSSRPASPDRGDEPAEAGIGRRIARIAW